MGPGKKFDAFLMGRSAGAVGGITWRLYAVPHGEKVNPGDSKLIFSGFGLVGTKDSELDYWFSAPDTLKIHVAKGQVDSYTSYADIEGVGRLSAQLIEDSPGG